MNEKQQTAVQWLIEQIKIDQTKQIYSPAEWQVIFKIALEMEREQIVR